MSGKKATYDARVVDIRNNHLTVTVNHPTAAAATHVARELAASHAAASRILVYEVTEGRHGRESREVANVALMGRG